VSADARRNADRRRRASGTRSGAPSALAGRTSLQLRVGACPWTTNECPRQLASMQLCCRHGVPLTTARRPPADGLPASLTRRSAREPPVGGRPRSVEGDWEGGGEGDGKLLVVAAADGRGAELEDGGRSGKIDHGYPPPCRAWQEMTSSHRRCPCRGRSSATRHRVGHRSARRGRGGSGRPARLPPPPSRHRR